MSGPFGNQLSPTEPHRLYDCRYCGAVIFDTSGKVILQRRDQKPSIVNPGMITLFGGGQGHSESPQACIIRELNEELSINVSPDDLHLLGHIDKAEADGHITRCTIFSILAVKPDTLHLREGQAIVVNTAEHFLKNPSTSEVTKISIRAAVGALGK